MKYVNQREAIMMEGCQTNWKAKNWTIDNLLNRYNNITVGENEQYYFPWKVYFQKTTDGTAKDKVFTSSQIQTLINAGYFIKIFRNLPRRDKG